MKKLMIIISILMLYTAAYGVVIKSQKSDILGTEAAMDGNVTKPGNPCFSAIPSAEQANIALDDFVIVSWGTEIFDVGSDFASSVFTAPVTGRYLLNINLRLDQVDSSAGYYQALIVTSNRNYIIATTDSSGLDSDPAFWNFSGSFIADMDATDIAYVAIYQNAGTQQTDIATGSYFNGTLLN